MDPYIILIILADPRALRCPLKIPYDKIIMSIMIQNLCLIRHLIIPVVAV